MFPSYYFDNSNHIFFSSCIASQIVFFFSIHTDDLGADYMSRAGSVEGLALSAEMTVQPGITWGGPARLRLNLEAVVWKDGYIEEHESSVFNFTNPLFWRIIFGFT